MTQTNTQIGLEILSAERVRDFAARTQTFLEYGRSSATEMGQKTGTRLGRDKTFARRPEFRSGFHESLNRNRSPKKQQICIQKSIY